MHISPGIACLLLVLLLQTACGTSGEQRKLETLDDAIKNYAYALRWGRIDDALAYHINEDGVRPEIDTSVMDSVRVTSFRITLRELDSEQTEAMVEGEMSYYLEQSGTLRDIEYRQRWWYQPDSKKWFLDSPFPEFH